MIKSIKHKGLRLLWEKDLAKGVPPELAGKIDRILSLLNRGPLPDALAVPGLKLHELKGDRKGTWSVWASPNFRVTFKIEGHDAKDVDFEDYH
jgi:proteic killer suppression protein